MHTQNIHELSNYELSNYRCCVFHAWQPGQVRKPLTMHVTLFKSDSLERYSLDVVLKPFVDDLLTSKLGGTMHVL